MCRCLETCEFLDGNKGPGVKQARLKAHMRRAEARRLLGSPADAEADVAEALQSIPDLSDAERGELNTLRARYIADVAEAERIGRLRREAGVAGDCEGGAEGEAAAGGDAEGDKDRVEASMDGAPAAEPPAPAPAAAPASPAPAAPGADKGGMRKLQVLPSSPKRAN